MASTPRPKGWEGGGEDFEFVRTLDGHMAVNELTDPNLASDINWRRNARSVTDADLSGEYDVHNGRR